MHTVCTAIATAVAGLLASCVTAYAQAIDYSALQDVIGEPVTTSVTGKPQRASELPGSMIVITAEQIVRSPARDVPSLLKTYAGIDVNRWTAGQSDVAVRGGVQTYNARLLVLVDGRQVYLDHYGMTNWNLLGVASEDIQQIELLRGPASALYGFNASTGVVNIITRKPGDTTALRTEVSAGNHGMNRVAASLYVPVTDRVGAKVTASRLREDERRVPATILDRPRFTVAADHVAAALDASSGATTATLGGGYDLSRQVEFLPTQLLSNQLYRSYNLRAGMTHDTEWGGLAFSGFVDWLDADYGTDGSIGGLARGLTLSNRIMVGKAAGLYRLGADDTLRLGFEFRNNHLASNAQYADIVGYNVASANAMIDLHPTGRVTTTAAVRLDQLWLYQSGAIARPAVDDPASYRQAFHRVSFNAAVLVRTGIEGQLRINGGLGYQLPSLTNYAFRLEVALPEPLPASLIVAGSPNIRPTGTWSAEIGYSDRRGGIRGEATAFYAHTNGAIAPPSEVPSELTEVQFLPGPVIVERYYAAGDYTTFGTELTLSGRLAVLDWRANYTWTTTRSDLDNRNALSPILVQPALTTPTHKVNVELGYDGGDRWLATGVLRYTSATQQFALAPEVPLAVVKLFHVADAIALDARLGFRLSRGIEVFVAGENLTLAGGAAVSPIPADRRVRGGLRATF